MRGAGLVAIAWTLAIGCATAPGQTAGQKALTQNLRAIVAGRVLDGADAPVSGIRVEALPRSRDVLWPAAATTDAEGRFELALYAPAAYGFLLCRRGQCVVTDDPRDPSRVFVTVGPGERQDGIELRFLSERWEEILD